MWLSCPWLDLGVPNHKSNWTCQARTCAFVISVYGSMGLSFRWFWSMCATLDIKLCMLVKNTCNDSSRHFRWYLDIAFLVGSLCLFCLLWPQSVRLGWTNCGWICWRKERMNESNGCAERWMPCLWMVEIECVYWNYVEHWNCPGGKLKKTQLIEKLSKTILEQLREISNYISQVLETRKIEGVILYLLGVIKLASFFSSRTTISLTI